SSIGRTIGQARIVLVTGDFTVRVQQDNFAKYALFTNDQRMADGTLVWFNNRTNFYGPVHTNGRLNFALNPSATFAKEVTQHELTAVFYNNGTNLQLAADRNG